MITPGRPRRVKRRVTGMQLTAAHLRYLLAIYEVSRTHLDISSRSIAEKLGVTKPSVVRIMNLLMERGMIVKEHYGKIYLMLGINELGNDLDDITAKFSSLIDTVRAAQPDAIIFVEANLHVGPSRSSTDATFNNPRIDKLNEKLAALADGKTIFYIDINELFDDENGNLRADASGDSTHVYAKYDLDWSDWLCTKAIVR